MTKKIKPSRTAAATQEIGLNRAKEAYAEWRKQYDIIENARETLEPLAKEVYMALTAASLPLSFTSVDGHRHAAVAREDTEGEGDNKRVVKTTYMVKTYGEKESGLKL